MYFSLLFYLFCLKKNVSIELMTSDFILLAGEVAQGILGLAYGQQARTLHKNGNFFRKNFQFQTDAPRAIIARRSRLQEGFARSAIA